MTEITAEPASNTPQPLSFLDMPLRYVKGVGPKLSEKFEKKFLTTVFDLLHYYPRTYKSQRTVENFENLQKGQYAVVEGEVFHKKIQRRRSLSPLYIIVLRNGRGDFFSFKYFKLPFRGFFDSIEIGQRIKAGGEVRFFDRELEFHHPEFFLKSDKDEGLLAVYPEIEGVSQKKIRKVIVEILNKLFSSQNIESFEVLPQWLRKEFHLMTGLTALKDIHQPQGRESSYFYFQSESQKTLIFGEFFNLQLHLALRKLKIQKTSALRLSADGALGQRFIDSLPFDLTTAQKKVFEEIKQDLKKPYPMKRLIQGDVGSGKTITAFQACLHAVSAGGQTALMAPTEILAHQHFQKAKNWLEPLGVRVEILTSKIKNKKNILSKIAQGECDLCLGTHALIQEGVQFKNLVLSIVDEQHRFGVHQRQKLTNQGVEEEPHCLVMTATPIPRTLAMTLYGDLDISIIDEMPRGRKPVITKKTKKRMEVFSFLEKEVLKGRQGYVVYPLVEKSEKIDLKNAVEQFEKLSSAFSSVKWGLIHGRLSADEKLQIMNQFKAGKIQILVTTTVVEVGVDVPNASVMVVEHSERFGLSQLHQLRGRIGRGAHQSYCVLIYSNSASKESLLRLKAMENISDGFVLAEEDLKIRGAGEFLGTKQSGLSHFKMANLSRDAEILRQSARAAQLFIDRDPYFKNKEHLRIKSVVEKISKIRAG